MGRDAGQILQGWKDIATYISRDVRTARRWEKLRGLPVRRNAGGGRANVYALTAELDRWLGSFALETDSQQDELLEVPEPEEDLGTATVYLHGATSHRWLAASLALLLIAVSALAFRLHRRSQGDRATVKASTTSNGVPYPSKVSGVTELYLRGLYLNDRRTPQDFKTALPVLLEATAKDPGYAPAWTALANTYICLNQFSRLDPTVAYPAAREAALRALALDPQLARPHTELGILDAVWSLDFPGSEREFRQAIALDPNDAFTHHWFGTILLNAGLIPQALEELDRAQSLQPGVTNVLISRAYAFGLSGHRDEAVAQIEEIARIDPTAIAAPGRISGLCLLAPRDIPCYLKYERRHREMVHFPEGVQSIDRSAAVFHRSGEAAMWDDELQRAVARRPEPFAVARLEAITGHKDDALRDLARLAQERNMNLDSLNINQYFLSLHTDPRFRQIEASLGLPAVP